VKRVFKWTLIILILVVVSFIIQSFLGNHYFQWFFMGKYEIIKANIEQKMDNNGIMHVHEVITYKMRKPFRGVYRYIPASRAVEISNVRVWLENIKMQRVEYLKNNSKEFEARIWISKNYNETISPTDVPTVILHVEYDAKYTFEKGVDVSQVFRQFWGTGWDAPAKNITATFEFPSTLKILSVYSHPKIQFEKYGNKFTFNVKSLPPFTYAEARFVFDNKILPNIFYNNPTLTKTGIENEEAKYKSLVLKAKIYPVIGLLIIIAFLILIFYFFGREKEIQYQGIYEREIPFKDPPDIVNAIVVNQLSKVDSNGISSVIMDLYRKDYVKLDKDGKYIEILEKDTKELPGSEKYFYEILKKYSFDNNKFSFDELKKVLSKDKKLAKEFLADFKAYKSLVLMHAKSRRYLSIKGTVLSYFVGIASILLALYFFAKFWSVSLIYESVFSSILFVTGGILFFLPRDVFGNWTRFGREYYLKWKNFEKFLLDFSALSQYPPESIIIWEDYLVYATALGIADKVEKHLKKLAPKEIEESSHPYYGYRTYRRYGMGFFVVSSVATSTVSKGSGSGFGGGVGGAGGGSGGGGGGAF